MLVVNRFRVPLETAEEFRRELEEVQVLLAAAPGYDGGAVGRNIDDPELWLLQTSWVGVGAYRRAIGSYDAKLRAQPLLARAIDEPSAYESVLPGRSIDELDRRVGAEDRRTT